MGKEIARVVDILPGLVWSALPDGRVEFVNRRWREYTGLDLGQPSDAGWHAVIHPDDLAQWLERWRSLSTSDQAWELELRLRRADGAYRWFICRACPEIDTTGRVLRWCGINSDIDDRRRRAERDLRAAETNYRGWVGSFPGLMVTMNLTGRLQLFSHEVLEYFGKTPDELQNWAMSDAVHPDDLDRAVAAFTDSVNTGKPYTVEHRCRRADGIYRWFQVRALAVRDDDGRITGWYVVLTDIDDLKRAEHAMRAREGDLAIIINAIPALAWSASTDGRAEFFNQHYLDFVGLSAEQARGWDWTTAVHADDLDGLAATWQRIMASEELGEAEVRLRRHDGEYRWFLLRANPLRDEAGNVVKWYGVNTDIEDRKRAEAQLGQAYGRLAEAQRVSKTGSFVTDLAADRSWSEETYRIFEFEPATEVTVQRVRDVVHVEDRPSFDAAIARIRTGMTVDYVFRIVTHRGTLKYVRCTAHVFEETPGRPVFVGAVQDVTETKLAEEALSTARAELAHVARVMSLSALTASITHEVNQPLSGIITNASTCLRMLDADPPNIDGARETARRAVRDGNRAADVITRLRALFSRKEVVLEPLDLNDATREVLALSSHDLQRGGVVLRTELAEDLPAVTGDRVQLQQVILNLLRNASEAMADVHDRPRQLLVRTDRETDDRVRLTVRDVGVGLDRQRTDKLFDAFYTTKSGGMGIGLSVSRSIIESHRGRIWAEPNEGPGATFGFSIPTAPGPSPQSTARSSATQRSDAHA